MGRFVWIVVFCFLFIFGTSCGGSGSSTATTTYSVGGTITGLSGTVILQNNLGDNLTITADGRFTFTTQIANATTYSVTVLTNPDGETCTPNSNTGTISGTNITDVSIICASSANSYTVGGNISGQTGTVVLQNNSGDDLTVASTDTSFTFATKVANAATYSVTVKTAPSGQTCSVSNGSGTISGANVATIAITCSSSTYTVGGTVSGLSGTVVLQNNSGNDLSITANGSFTFTTAIANGATYTVTVLTSPSGQSCSVANGNSTVSGANVSNVAVTCTDTTYSLGGTVSGLTDTVAIQNNASATVLMTTNSTYFYTLDSGSSYSISIAAQPAGQSCSITGCSEGSLAGGTCSGTITENISDVNISCVDRTYSVGGTVSGLTGTIGIQNNGGSTILLNSNTTYFYTLDYGDSYSITIAAQPDGQTCTISGCSGGALSGGACSGTVAGDISDITIGCTTP